MKAAELFDIKGQVAVVTGAASGIGLAYAEVMAENGARTMLMDMDSDNLATVAGRLRDAGCEVDHIALDVSDTARLGEALDRTVKQWGRLDIVFANAGASGGPGFGLTPDGRIENADLARYDRTIEVNQQSVFHTIRLAAAIMRRQRSGSIIATSSIAGLRSEAMVSYGYAAAKAAVNNIVRHAACDLAADNVRVNAIAPGAFYTNIGGGHLRQKPEVERIFAAVSPMNRIAETHELKGLALLLASRAGSFITGAVIPCDGGSTAR
jgi:NAD(P)-dependent dehydrogenase (short-subunit alcohol dehydrogenase family)